MAAWGEAALAPGPQLLTYLLLSDLLLESSEAYLQLLPPDYFTS